MPSIHPTALVSDSANLASDVEVGPFAIIEDGVTLGAGCRIDSHAKICRGVTMGAGNVVGHGAVIGGDPQDLSFDPTTPSGVLIGDQNTFREGVTINRSTQDGGATVIGNENFLMAVSHLAHDVTIGSHNVLANNSMVAGHCRLGDSIFIGGGAGLHQFIYVGNHAMIQGNAGMTKDVPPYCIAHQINQLSGLNIIGLKRAGFTPDERKEIKQAYKHLFTTTSTRSEALARADEIKWGPAATKLIEAFRNPSRKGILTR